MHEMVATGKYHVPSEDIQCLDGYYPAFESKEIEVHDSEENRNAFYDAVLSHWLKTAQYGMSKIDKKAFVARIPHLAEVIK